MKNLPIFIALLLAGCSQQSQQIPSARAIANVDLIPLHSTRYSDGVWKFKDGRITCYMFADQGGRSGMSCLEVTK